MKYKRGIMSLLVFSMLITLLLPGSVIAAEKDEVTAVPITVTTSEKTPDDTTFTIIVKEKDSDVTYKKITLTANEVKAGKKTEVAFGPYEEPGEHFFTIYEVTGDKKGVTYSTTKYVIKVTAANQFDANGNFVGIVPVAHAWKEENADTMKKDDKEKIVFNNTYYKKSQDDETKTTKSVKTGDNSNIYFWTILAAAAAAACIMLLYADQKKRKKK